MKKLLGCLQARFWIIWFDWSIEFCFKPPPTFSLRNAADNKLQLKAGVYNFSRLTFSLSIFIKLVFLWRDFYNCKNGQFSLMDTYHCKYITSNLILLYPLVKCKSKPNVKNLKWGLIIACKWVFDIRFWRIVNPGVD